MLRSNDDEVATFVACGITALVIAVALLGLGAWMHFTRR